MIHNLLALLAPTGRLRVGINMANFLLVTGRRPDGTPDGVSPDLARQFAHKLDVPCDFICFENPGQLADGATLKQMRPGLRIGCAGQQARQAR